MKTIIVDDEAIMLRSFKRLSEGISAIHLVGEFQYPEEALAYAKENPVELAILDISMPGMTGLVLAKALKNLRPDMLIVFITAYDEYVRESNQIGIDYYIVKPYKREVIEQMADRMQLLARRQQKNIFIQTFGRFLILRDDSPIALSGKAKEILALIVTRRGKEISNEEIYSTIWEGRPYGNAEMKVYYNALKRLKDALAEQNLSELLVSTARGQTVNTELFDCDYYAWQDKNMGERDKFTGEFMAEYSWGEYILADILKENWQPFVNSDAAADTWSGDGAGALHNSLP